MAVTGPLSAYPGLNSPSPVSVPSPVSGPSDAGISGGAIAGIVISVLCCAGISMYLASKGQMV